MIIDITLPFLSWTHCCTCFSFNIGDVNVGNVNNLYDKHFYYKYFINRSAADLPNSLRIPIVIVLHLALSVHSEPSLPSLRLISGLQLPSKKQCCWKTFMFHQTFVRWALYILFKFVKSLIRHLGLAIGNVWCVRWFSWTLKKYTGLCDNWGGTMHGKRLMYLDLPYSDKQHWPLNKRA